MHKVQFASTIARRLARQVPRLMAVATTRLVKSCPALDLQGEPAVEFGGARAAGACSSAGVRKARRHEIAVVGSTAAVPQAAGLFYLGNIG